MNRFVKLCVRHDNRGALVLIKDRSHTFYGETFHWR